MGNISSASTPDIGIRIDNMEMTVTNRYPVRGEQTEKEVRQEISARLYRIFRNYDESYVSRGGA
ncbi:MAG: hypothetical protein HDR15_09980 [Lachnospiraceae bacterium]|nr:hypothetical protein [Lachnospiraceae bacterium]